MSILRSRFKNKRIFLEISMVIVSLLYIVPGWMVLVNSFKASREAFKLGLGFPSMGWHPENYFVVFSEGKILRAFLNGVFIAVLTIIASCVTSSMGAFVIARRNSKVTSFVYNYFIVGMIIPSSIVPTFLLFKILHLTNTYSGITLLFISLTIPLSIFIYTGFIKTIPREFDEAAIIDGCGTVRLFFFVIFPLLQPATATLAVFHFIGVWNDVTNQLFFIQGDKWMLPMSVYRFYGSYTYDWNLVFADVVISLLPLVVIYLAAQKYIISGLTMGAVKG